MKIIAFNISKGIYKFEIGKINTDFHSHPAYEILFSRNGTLTIETLSAKFENVYFAVIPANLSESRISHVFKNEVGTSLKKYLVWSKLKRTFELVINGKMNMFEASLESGFYDQAHLSKAFKQMFGVKPSKTYNSRTIQK